MEDIINIARELIKRDDIEAIIGYEKGRAPFQTVPFFARTPEDCDKLIMNSLCVNNLVSYINQFSGKVAIFVKPCDAKALVGLLQEHQIEREKLHIIGINCQGALNPKKLRNAIKGRMVKDWSINGDKIKVYYESGEEEFNIKDFLLDKCPACDTRTPPIYDELLGDEIKTADLPELLARVKELEKLPAAEKQQYWNEHFERCLRCYACVKICPLCYCERCFVENASPQWIDKSNNLKSNKAFHLIRAYHLAGRCIDCGECDRACPMDIPLRELNLKMRKSVEEHFNYVPGKDIDVPPPLSTFKKEDPQDFIR
ncbi:MAG TPA: Coenzyme F420 hydrogenase/dehydrogenase, beta subunit C-terminal domain [Candidatus Eremiobacteraeota bacterium]|nr:MAG: hypothetical protein BWY64_02710 [bacterium ADurb.Bin363]HPZ07669.1 Coenzyme F420 hydrogenase/dehydrogenase, beta subunit C-terminal domain [Candidatus Eremiobacteraeota bacterium]